MAKHKTSINATSPRSGGITARIWPLYYPHDYEKAREAWVSFEMAGKGYDEYLEELAKGVDEDLTKYGVVMMAPMYVEEISEWTKRAGLNADSAAARRKYLRTYPPGGLYGVQEVSGLFTLLRADSMKVLRSTTISSQNEGINLAGFHEALEVSEKVAVTVYAELSEALVKRANGLIDVTYSAYGLLNGTRVPLEGEMTLSVENAMVAVESSSHEELLRALIRLGTVGEAKLSVKVRAEDGETVTLEWVISPSGVVELGGVTLGEAGPSVHPVMKSTQ